MEDIVKKSDNDIVFSQTVNAGKRIYYLDVKKNRREDLFLCITESRKIVSDNPSLPFQIQKHKLFLYKEDFEKFMNAMNEALDYINENNTEESILKEKLDDFQIEF